MTEVSKQEKLREFVNENVYADISDMYSDLIDFSDCGEQYADFSEFENSYCYTCPNCGCNVEWDDSECTECGSDMTCDGPETITAEPFEWYIVSTFLGEALIEHGECVLRRTMGYIWGRQTTGQAIILDGVIESIADEVGILPE